MTIATTVEARKLFLLGFATLFLELALIRYLAGSIWNLGYFPNLVLIAVFVGMGAGFIFHHHLPAAASPRVYEATIFAVLLLVLLVRFARPHVPGFGTWQSEIGGELFFTFRADGGGQGYGPFVATFLGVIVVFALLSQRTAKVFREFEPLTAYTLDIMGSCAGILAFMVASWLSLSAATWFAMFSLVFIAAAPGPWRARGLLPLLPGLAIVALVHQQDQRLSVEPSHAGGVETIWSPYQKVEYAADFAADGRPGRTLYVNGIGHQTMGATEELQRQMYQLPYAERSERPTLSPYRRVLILGAGSGNDVAVALANGAERVVAVEIDPVIARFGRSYHPARPYDDPRVELVVDDGRAYLTRCEEEFDLILFALTDSLVKVSSVSQLRLENYLFTRQAVERAYRLLSAEGDLFFYNYYRKLWLVAKIRSLLQSATGRYPLVRIYAEGEGQSFLLATLKVGRAAGSQDRRGVSGPSVEAPTDDWPFLYLRQRGVPTIYRWAMAGMLGLVLLLMASLYLSSRDRAALGGSGRLPLKLAFALMGAAFLLLETKSVIQFSLLFGTTWLNNSLVFLAVLGLVLAANWTARYLPIRWTAWSFALLLASSLGALVVPLGSLLAIDGGLLRFFVASLLIFSPIFFANLIFSITFRDQTIPEHLFGWNLIGATVGGVVEYLAMATGYRVLSVLVAASYTLVVLLLLLARARSGRAA